MPENDRVFAAIIGGGCMGLAVADALARLGRGPVALVERESTHGAGSTGLGAGGVRAQFSTAINIGLSLESMVTFAQFEEETGTPLAFDRIGYLFLASTAEGWRQLREHNALQRSMGVPAELLAPGDVTERFGFLDIARLHGAAWCATDGVVDPHTVVQGYAKSARRLGVEMVMNSNVRSLRHEAPTWTVETADRRIDATNVVIAAGVWSPQIAATVGVDLPIRPLRRICYVTDPIAGMPDRVPFVVDTATGFWMRPESGGVLMGGPRADEPEGFHTDMDWTLLESVLRSGRTVAPFLEGARARRGWAGLYEMTPDLHPIVGPVDGRPGLFVAAGFSGHGFMHAPAVGTHLADVIARGQSSLDLAPLALSRFAGQGLVREDRYV